MTTKEWLKKYYPVPANNCPEEDAVAHSLLKWQGVVEWVKEHDSEKLPIDTDGDTCALCVHYCDRHQDPHFCEMCPLKLHLGARCDNHNGPWDIWNRTGNPEPMLDALVAVKAKE